MRVSLNWIKEFVDVDIDIHELKELLTMHGLEVEAVELLGRGLRDVLCAKIVSVKSHPNADRLMLCDVDMGDRVVQVVSGAPNLREGLKVPIALPGTILPGGNRVKEVKLRGEISTQIASWHIPALPGAQYISSISIDLFFRAHTKACSLPPEPITNTFLPISVPRYTY